MTRYRLYFNRELEWPQCWSVDEGDQSSEINIVGFELRGVQAVSRTLPRGTVADRQTTPFAWLEVAGSLRVQEGVAIVTPGAGRLARWYATLRRHVVD